ncbi:MAG: bifunctional UDP-N-acetylmuramoyl-tripeptide:D-alanyl-D-alanine ligase/alanine racemase, partial [Bacteroidota bacterium]|nr:bifunctional UDP-N-acetylmuramoyl-tripeptide:D-alanyl-D-alanine ligase/alanine racemase [Bacteroidota bacterium]
MSGYSIEELKKVLAPVEIFGTNGRDCNILRLSIDSRGVLAGEQTMFFAIRGDKRDGHDFISDAYQKQVRVFVVDKIEKKWLDFSDAVFLRVDDTLQSLQKLAAWHRQQLKCPVLGITGSNGKTIVKEWLFEILQDQFVISRSPKSYNSQIGVPLSVWLMDCQSQLAIFEAGISKPGEMGKLAEIITPDYGIFTNITGAHQENFSSLEEKAKEKAKLFEHCKTIVYCCDQPIVDKVLKEVYCNLEPTLFSWSFVRSDASLLIRKKELERGVSLSIDTDHGEETVTIPFSDAASVENAAQCLAMLVALKLQPSDFKKKFESLVPVAMRLEIKQGINNCSLIDDSYNSDINSLEIALELLVREAKSSRSKKTLILSDIYQSGYAEQELYERVAELIHLRKIDRLIGVGAAISAHAHLFDCEKEFYITTDNFTGHFEDGNFRNETILLKGSRAFRFDLITGLLQEKAHQTVMEVNLNALVHNLNYFRSLLDPSTKVVAMVKAFSYGSGAAEIASLLQYHRIDYLAVAIADEGVELRKAGIRVPIIVMNPESHGFDLMIEYQLEPNIYSLRQLRQFNEAVQRHADRLVPVHIKLETGMKRLGIDSDEELKEVIAIIKKSQNLFVRSVFSHLSVSDEPDQDEFTQYQFN